MIWLSRLGRAVASQLFFLLFPFFSHLFFQDSVWLPLLAWLLHFAGPTAGPQGPTQGPQKPTAREEREDSERVQRDSGENWTSGAKRRQEAHLIEMDHVVSFDRVCLVRTRERRGLPRVRCLKAGKRIVKANLEREVNTS